MMKRAKGVALAEGWEKHTVRGSVSILGSKVGQKIERRTPLGSAATRSRSSLPVLGRRPKVF